MPQISTKRATTSSHHKTLNTLMSYDRNKDVAVLNRVMRSFTIDINKELKTCTYSIPPKKTTHYHKNE